MAAPIAAVLNSSIQQSPIDVDIKYELIKEFWGVTIDPLQYYNPKYHFDPYFQYYIEECDAALRDRGRHTSVRTHFEVVEIVREFQLSSSRERIAQNLKGKLTPETAAKPDADDIINASIDMALRLYLMLDFGVVPYGFTGREASAWTAGDIKTFISQHFKDTKKLDSKGVKLQKIFNARNLGRIAGIKIEWTTNLADHLRLVDDDKKVAIFHYKSFLDAQKSNPIFQPFPDDFIQETLDTLALMFPPEAQVKRWFQKLARNGEYDQNILQCNRLGTESRQIENFNFWHDRLVILKQFFDEAEPSTVCEWWHDRRKYVQWYTFWVAAVVLILTILFGLVQCIEGGMQTWKAFHP